jgi:dsDNA-specific endonuclease/ATPase MutS2
VPCKKAVVGLSGYMQILIGDNQSLERGLSSFGSEMEVLKEILDSGIDRSLFLIDEIASGTNPKEGFALTKSLVDYLKDKPYISLITTHFDGIAIDGEVNNMQVIGLANVDFDELDREIRSTGKHERVNIISKYMDYRLHKVMKGKKVPKDALNIAKMLGINEEIIENAKKYLEGGHEFEK